MKSNNYYARQALRQEAAHMRILIERLDFQNQLLEIVAMRHGWTGLINIKLEANRLNKDYYSGRLDGIRLALRLVKS